MPAGANKAELKLIVEAVLKDQDLVKAQARIGDLEKKVGRLTQKLTEQKAAAGGLGTVFSEMQSKAMAWITGALAGAFIKNAVVEYAKVERALGAIKVQLEALGQGAALPKIEAFSEALEGIGRAQTTTLPALNRFIGLTRDSGQSIRLVKLASDLAVGSLGTYEGNIEALTALFKGRWKPAMAELGIATDAHGKKIETAAQAYQVLIDKVEILNKRAKDHQSQIAEMGGQWDQLKDKVGKLFVEAVPLISWVTTKAIALVKILFGEFLGFLYNLVINSSKAIGGLVEAIFNVEAMKKGSRVYLNQLQAAYNRAGELIKGTATDAWEGIKRVWNEKPETTGLNQSRAEIEKADKQMLARLKTAKDEAEDEDEKRRERELKAEQDKARRIAETNDRALIERLRAEVDQYPEHSQARLNAQMVLLDQELRNEIKAAEAEGRATTDIYAKFVALRQGILNHQLDWELSQIQAAAEKTLQEKEAAEKRSQDLDVRTIDLQIEAAEEGSALLDKLEMDKLKARQTREMEEEKDGKNKERLLGIHKKEQESLEKKQHSAALAREKQLRQSKLESAATTMGALAQLFPKVKAFALAEALINMYAGISAALDEKPWWVAVARVAWTLATGWQQINAIRSQNMARGGITTGPVRALIGEDPTHPGEAVIPLDSAFGQRVLANVVGTALKTVLKEGAIPNPAPVQHVTHIHEGDRFEFHSAVIDDTSLRLFMRRADRVRKLDQRMRTIR